MYNHGERIPVWRPSGDALPPENVLYHDILNLAHKNVITSGVAEYGMEGCAFDAVLHEVNATLIAQGFRAFSDHDVTLFYPALILNNDIRLKPLLAEAMSNESQERKRRDLPGETWDGFFSAKYGQKRCRFDWNEWCSNQNFHYDTEHERKFGFLALHELPHYLHRLWSGNIPHHDHRWKLALLLIQEFHEDLSINKLTCLLVMIFGLQHLHEYENELIENGPWRMGTNALYVKRAKLFTCTIRKYSTNAEGIPLSTGAITEASYLEMASGRSENRFDIETELKNRTSYTFPMRYPDPNGCWTEGQFDRILYQTMQEVMAEIDCYEPKKHSSAAVFRERGVWAPNGSSHTKQPWEDPRKGKMRQVKVTKRVFAQNVRWTHLVEHLATKPQITFTISDKFECAKGRAILSSDDMHSFISHLIMNDLESALHKQAWSGHSAGPGDSCKMLADYQKLLRSNFYYLGTDWDDYNIHECDRHQVIMAKACAEKYLSSQEWDDKDFERRICEWWISSFGNQWLRLSDEEWYRLLQGLGSGVRVTDFFNSLFNRCVWLMGERLCLRVAINYVKAVLVKQMGDDTGAFFEKIWCLCLTYYAILAMGARMNLFKQLASQNWAEMLRRVISRNDMRAFQNRAVGNFMSPPTQRSEAVSIAETVCARIHSIHEIVKRGYCFLAARSLVDMALEKADIGAEITKVHRYVLMQSRELGGSEVYFGILAHDPYMQIINQLPGLPVPREHVFHHFSRISCKSYATEDLVSLINGCITAGGLRLADDDLSNIDRLCDDKTKNDYQQAEPVEIRKRRLTEQERCLWETWADRYTIWKEAITVVRTSHRRFNYQHGTSSRYCIRISDIVLAQELYIYDNETVAQIFHDSGHLCIGVVDGKHRQEALHMLESYGKNLGKDILFVEKAIGELQTILTGGEKTCLSLNPYVRYYQKVTNWCNMVNPYTIARATKSDKKLALRIISYLRDEDWEMLRNNGHNVLDLLDIIEIVMDESNIPAVFDKLVGATISSFAREIVLTQAAIEMMSGPLDHAIASARVWEMGRHLAVGFSFVPFLSNMCVP